MKKLTLSLLLCTPACYAAADHKQNIKELATLIKCMTALQQVQDLPMQMEDANRYRHSWTMKQLEQVNAQKLEAHKAAVALAPQLVALAKQVVAQHNELTHKAIASDPSKEQE